MSHTLCECDQMLMSCRREAIAPLQTAEAVEVKKKSDAFGAKVEEFRKFFLAKAPFAISEQHLTLEHVRTLPAPWRKLEALHADVQPLPSSQSKHQIACH